MTFSVQLPTPGKYAWGPQLDAAIQEIVLEVNLMDIALGGPGDLVVTLPTVDEPNWGGPLNTAIQAVVDRINVQLMLIGGEGTDIGYQHVQTDPLATWTITVPIVFTRLPQVSIFDPDGDQVETDVNVTMSTVTITFPSPQTGTAVLS